MWLPGMARSVGLSVRWSIEIRCQSLQPSGRLMPLADKSAAVTGKLNARNGMSVDARLRKANTPESETGFLSNREREPRLASNGDG